MPDKNTYHAIGLMSGTSLDGLDIVYAEFSIDQNGWSYKINETASIAYDDSWRAKLKSAIDLSSYELDDLDDQYGEWSGEQVRDFLVSRNLKLDLIASHGHTIFHEPKNGITVQIGDGQRIADITGLTTVCDFRSGDVALGGQGAPLVPIGDELLFGDYLACVNLGGIANISFRKDGERIAFDVGLANMPLNILVEQLGLSYDDKGLIARSGMVSTNLLDKLNGLNYFTKIGPKSLGIEWYLEEVQPIIDNASISIEDKLATLVEHEAYQLGKTIEAIDASGEILVTGGGAYNLFLMERISSYLSKDKSIIIPDAQLVEGKEALIFGFMGVLRLRNEVNCLKSVTGASRDSCSGEVFLNQAI